MDIPIIGSLIGGAMDAYTQNTANAANERNVQKQIDFQREQSGTQWQRGVEDMKKAGLNPALAYEKGGNTASTGAAATVAPTTSGTGGKLASALQMQNMQKEGRLLEAQERKTDAEGASARADAVLKNMEAAWANIRDNQELWNRNKNATLLQQNRVAFNYPERYQADIAEIRARARSANAAASLSGSARRLNEQEYLPDTGWVRDANRWNNFAQRGIGTAKQAAGIISEIARMPKPAFRSTPNKAKP